MTQPTHVEDRLEQAVDMVHLSETCCGDDRRALCGAPLKGIDAPIERLDCVVCDELARAGVFCRTCGCRMVLP